MKSLIPSEKLAQAKRLLYMTHMAIGDYVYQRMFLKKLHENHPNLQIDLWFDNCDPDGVAWNLRRSQTLMEWFKEEPFLSDLYPVAASLKERESLIERAREKNYDLIVFSVDMWSEHYATTARKISKNAYIVGTLIKLRRNFFQKVRAFKECNQFYITQSALKNKRFHITKFYQNRFSRLLGLRTTLEEIRPHLDVPVHWQEHMRAWLKEQKQEHHANSVNSGTIFINYLSTNEKRDWSYAQARNLIIELNKLHSGWTYIFNLPPHMLPEIELLLADDRELSDIHVIPFSAQKHFYELPALIQLSNCVFSVETAIIHLASALGISQIALVRRKAHAWAPLDNEKTYVIFSHGLHNRIRNITVEEVVECYKKNLMKR